MIAPKVAIETKEMWPVVIDVVTSAPLGNFASPHNSEMASLFSGGVKVTSSTFGQIVQMIEMVAKLSMPIRAIRRRVARVNKLDSGSELLPKTAF